MRPQAWLSAAVLAALLCCSCGGGSTSSSNTSPFLHAQSTAQPEVSLLPSLLPMPSLNRQRQVRLYLPPGYATSGKRYPVLYMHDAQNLFDALTANAGEWRVDETLNDLARSGQLELIVVGIDNGPQRLQELNPWASAYGPGEGRQYMDFIVGVVKPLIDAQYRTLPGRENTGIMGSSMGGLISHYAIEQYPEVFSKAGIFSPSYWIAPEMFDVAAATRLPPDARLLLLMGGAEGGTMVPDVERMAGVVLQSGLPQQNLVLKIVPGRGHNEAFWSSEFREAVLWLFVPKAK